jgi:hypothetical protein
VRRDEIMRNSAAPAADDGHPSLARVSILALMPGAHAAGDVREAWLLR